MNTDNWKLELDRLLEIFERESTTSLRKINRCFVSSGCPFDEEFRKYFMDMSNRRLNTSFDTVLFERRFKDRMKMSSATSASTNDNEHIGNNLNTLNLALENENLKIETNVADATIEIVDSDDENEVEEQKLQAIDEPTESQTKSKALPESSDGNAKHEHEQNAAAFNDENDGIEVGMKREVKVENEIEMVDLPIVKFDPNTLNSSSDKSNDHVEVPESLENQNRPSLLLNKQMQSKKSDGKRFKCNDCEYTARYKCLLQKHQVIHEAVKPFKCEHCDYACKRKYQLIRHQRSHEQQKLMNIEQDPNDGLFKCTHCDQKFTKWCDIKSHLTRSHKNNQRLFNCERCMRRFTQKIEKDKHEIRCQNIRYECYLCKKYVTKQISSMKGHMRTHSGAKPFECAICSKRFRFKSHLKRHLNSIHSRTST